MFDRHWYRSLLRLLLPFVGTILVLSAGLVWLGWKTIEQDRALEQQRVRDRLERSADVIAAQLRQGLSELEEPLTRLAAVSHDGLGAAASAYAEGLGPDALVVIYGDGFADAYPSRRLPYYPGAKRRQGAPAELFAAGEAREFRAGDLAGAMKSFETLAQSNDEEIRAGALLRLARNQRKADLHEVALATYAALAEMGPVPVDGRPADLVARHARCRLLADAGREGQLEEELQALRADLRSGNWRIDRALWLYFFEDTQRLLEGRPDAREVGASAPYAVPPLAAGADFVRDLWQQRSPNEEEDGGRINLTIGEHSVLVAWRGAPDRVVALVGGPGFTEERLVGALRPFLELQSIDIVLADTQGRPVLADVTRPSAPTAVRTVADTGLPWTLRVVAVDPLGGPDELPSRTRLMFAALALLAVSVVAGTYFSGRAMSREMKAARLQADFVAAVSHEFRTPLTSLRQFTDLLSDGRASTEQDRTECYAALQRGTRRLSRLVENLLDFGRLEAGSRAFDLRPLAARDFVEGIVAEFREEAIGYGYRVEMSWRGGDGVVQADAPALGRALWNLMDNAVKYSPDCKTIRVEGIGHADRVEIRVRDRGVGIREADRDRIFEKFVRGGDHGGSGVKGTGLGLALVRQIIDAHGGDVTLTSALGEGSTFSVILPAQG